MVGFALRAPQVGAHLPYLYDHDEAPVLNRLLLMVQEGRYDPGDFRYPSLTFYLRMPAVAAGFLHAAQAGEIGSIHEVMTANHSVRGEVARTASHPRIVMWARSVTTAFGLLLILLTYLIARRVSSEPWVAGVAALLVALTPPLIDDSEKVGVDTLMAAMCLLTVWLSLRLMEQPTAGRAALAGLAAGLAVSSKYNAAPVVLVPVLAVLLSGRWSAGALAAALGLPAVGFVAGTPYSVINMPGFLDGMAYQVNWYAIRGFGEEWTVEPGWPHAARFLQWMFDHASGAAVTIAGIAGGLLLPLSRRRAAAVVVLIFPALFCVLMLNQRIAFFRNMFVLLPFFAITATWFVERTGLSLQRRLAQRAGAALVLALVCLLAAQPAARSFDLWQRTNNRPESRRLVSAWLAENATPETETAVAADLQLPWPDYSLPGVSSLRSDQLADPVALFLNGFDRLVAGPFTERRLTEALRSSLRIRQVFPGVFGAWETLRNPRVTIYDLPAILARQPRIRARVGQDDRYLVTDGRVRTRLARLGAGAVDLTTAAGGGQRIGLELRTPWPSQSCRLELGDWQSADLCAGLEPNVWASRSIDVPIGVPGVEAELLWVSVTRVHRDPAAGNQRDQRIGLEIAMLEPYAE